MDLDSWIMVFVGWAYYSDDIKIRFRFCFAVYLDILQSTSMRRQLEHGKVLSQRI